MFLYFKAGRNVGEEVDMSVGRIICGFLDHSQFTTNFFGYVYCARCGEEMGDNLAGSFANGISINSEHELDCKNCMEIRNNMSFKERFISKIEEPILRRIIKSPPNLKSSPSLNLTE